MALNNSPNLNSTEVSAQPALKKYKGARRRQSGGYVAEISHARQKIWLGTFATADEAALAYDLAAQRLKGRTYNFEDQNITTIDPAKKAEIGKKVEEKLEGKTRTRSNDVDKRARTTHKKQRTRKRGNEEFRRESKSQNKRKVEKKQTDEELDGFL